MVILLQVMSIILQIWKVIYIHPIYTVKKRTRDTQVQKKSYFLPFYVTQYKIPYKIAIGSKLYIPWELGGNCSTHFMYKMYNDWFESFIGVTNKSPLNQWPRRKEGIVKVSKSSVYNSWNDMVLHPKCKLFCNGFIFICRNQGL